MSFLDASQEIQIVSCRAPSDKAPSVPLVLRGSDALATQSGPNKHHAEADLRDCLRQHRSLLVCGVRLQFLKAGRVARTLVTNRI